MDANLLYAELIAGALPRAKTKPEQAILLMAGAALQTPRVHFVSVRDDTAVYYLAMPSRSLSSEPDFRTPLAAALPGHPDHQGDGAYLLELGPHAAVVIKQGATLRYLYNTLDAIEMALALDSLPIYSVSQFEPWRLDSMPGLMHHAGHQLGAWVTRVAMGWSAVTLLVALGAMSYNAYRATDQLAATAKTQLNSLLESTAMVQPMTDTLAGLQRLSAVTVKAGGWLERYRITGTDEVFVIWLPAWISRDYIEALGPDVKTNFDREKNLVRAYKGTLKEQK